MIRFWFVGATAYEFQIGRFWFRFLRPRYWFWPYRYHVVTYRSGVRWVFPKLIRWGVKKK